MNQEPTKITITLTMSKDAWEKLYDASQQWDEGGSEGWQSDGLAEASSEMSSELPRYGIKAS